jgi:hypothetical protein
MKSMARIVLFAVLLVAVPAVVFYAAANLIACAVTR